MSVLAIIPAAGVGIRMGGGIPKQFLCLEGTPIFVHTLRKFAASEVIDHILLGLRAEDTERVRAALESEGLAKPVRLVTGGPSRQQTVRRALDEAPEGTELVAVHDAVRPFVSLDLIRRVVETARQTSAAIPAVPSVDTVKQIERQIVLGTIPRERVVLAQTPQVFRYDVLREAFDRAQADGFHATDEASLVERLGVKVTVLMGSPCNIKITKPSDLPVARLYLAQERERGKSESEP